MLHTGQARYTPNEKFLVGVLPGGKKHPLKAKIPQRRTNPPRPRRLAEKAHARESNARKKQVNVQKEPQRPSNTASAAGTTAPRIKTFASMLSEATGGK